MFSALLCSDFAVRSAAELYPGCYIFCLFSLVLGKGYFDFHYITSLSTLHLGYFGFSVQVLLLDLFGYVVSKN